MFTNVVKKVVLSKAVKEAAKKAGTEGLKRAFDGITNKVMNRGNSKIKHEEPTVTIQDFENFRTHVVQIIQQQIDLSGQIVELKRQLDETRAEIAATKIEAAKPWWKKW